MTPTTLDEAVKALDEILSPEDRNTFRNWDGAVEDLIAEVHHSLGRYLRNTWGLWKNSTLAKHMQEVHGIAHPDDMSHEIIVAYCRQGIRTRFERIE